MSASIKLRGGPKDYVHSDIFQDDRLGTKAYMLLRQRRDIDSMNDQFTKYMALVEWKDEADAFNILCESNFNNAHSSNLIEFSKKK
ncbi:hypothetical protein [Pseudoalteromonas sp. PS5]|uniref:hypothetical protein n=1 Tax=Pseudoalteromonas sp. PS5 TaxID=1437473 RepID=UPI000FFE8474|nr:hypothetical protein [Pseudoalteromonas sp. PS5]